MILSCNVFTRDPESGEVLPVFGGKICGVFFDCHSSLVSGGRSYVNGSLWRLYRAFEWGRSPQTIIPDLQIIIYSQLYNAPAYLKDEYSQSGYWIGHTLSPSDFYYIGEEDGSIVRVLDGCSFATLARAMNNRFSHYKFKMWW